MDVLIESKFYDWWVWGGPGLALIGIWLVAILIGVGLAAIA